MPTPAEKSVLCLGASMTRGRYSVNWVTMLVQRLGPAGYRFLNAGVDGDLAYNALQRLAPLLAARPGTVVILLGTNDVTSVFNPAVGRKVRQIKKLPQDASPEWYRANVTEIVRRCCESGVGRIGLCSLPPLGEDLAAPANALMRSYNALLAGIAASAGPVVTYVPVYERMAERLAAEFPAGGAAQPRAVTPDMLSPLTLKFLFYHRGLRLSLDRISRLNRFRLFVEGVHLNTAGATIVANAVEPFLLA
jgi:lysophospholipase L1-like esterase